MRGGRREWGEGGGGGGDVEGEHGGGSADIGRGGSARAVRVQSTLSDCLCLGRRSEKRFVYIVYKCMCVSVFVYVYVGVHVARFV